MADYSNVGRGGNALDIGAPLAIMSTRGDRYANTEGLLL
jgi:hypothetical protein